MSESDDFTAQAVDPLIGTKLGGQYTIKSLIGSGGMGSVYRARQELMGRDVAIKFLPQHLTEDDVNVQRLSREAKALGRLNHPNIVTTYEFCFTDKREPYLVLELVDGSSLNVELKTLGYIPFGASVPIFIQLVDAMKYAHANGVVHRDLKPHNIMIIRKDGKMTAKILDFGIAQLEDENQRLTRAGEIWGSPYYMSPEQCSGEEVDHRTDIYSLGVIMYLTLSGQLPHKGDSFTDTVNKKLSQPAPRFAMLKLPESQTVPADLEEIIIHCLRRKPAERYQSMGELKDALLAFCEAANVPSTLEPNLHRASQNRMPAAKVKTPTPPHIIKGADQANNMAKFVLPLVALLAVAAVGAFGLYIGMALQAHKDPIPAKDSTTAKPPVEGVIPPSDLDPAKVSPHHAADRKGGDTKAVEPAARSTVKSVVASPDNTTTIDVVQVDHVNVRVKPLAPIKKAINAVKHAVQEHNEKAELRAEERRALREAKKEAQEQIKEAREGRHAYQTQSKPPVPDESSEFKPYRKYSPNDSNAFYRRFGGARD